MNDLKVIYNKIIKNSGKESNDFPYEYEIVPDFSITINPEDWVVGGGETKVIKSISVFKLDNWDYRVWKCNEVETFNTSEAKVVIHKGSDYYTVNVAIFSNEIHFKISAEINPNNIGSVVFNFTKLISIGDVNNSDII